MRVDGEALRRDREQLGYSRDAFLDAVETKTGKRLSVMTLRRAESGTASMVNLIAFAEVTGFPDRKYLLSDSDEEIWTTPFNLAGRWMSYYLEDDAGSPPYLSKDNLFLFQNGTKLEGIYEIESSKNPEGWIRDSSFTLSGTIVDNVVFGTFFVSGRRFATGVGTFQLAISGTGGIAEGFCSYFGDDNKILLTKHVWIRKGISDFSILESRTEQDLENSAVWKTPFIMT